MTNKDIISAIISAIGAGISWQDVHTILSITATLVAIIAGIYSIMVNRNKLKEKQ
ncbi:MAG: hypothetical protein N4A72_14675 [Bacteroidales bacterium]|jgi:hypothetical protein|nr:hypothetical protein [Bacteroidales bacterium]